MKIQTLVVAGLVLALSLGCKTAKPEKQFFNEVGDLSKQAVLDKGDAYANDKRWEDARRYYSYLSDSFPNDPLGRAAALKVADTFFAEKHLDSLTEAQLRFRDFSNRFPNDPARAYALLMLGKCSFLQKRGPMRDLTPVKEAVESFRQVIKLFPDSPHAAEARTLLAQGIEDLAVHELEIARFYATIGAWHGARQRVDYLLATYPDAQAAKDAAPLKAEVDTHVAPVATAPSPATAAAPAPATTTLQSPATATLQSPATAAPASPTTVPRPPAGAPTPTPAPPQL